MAAAGGTRFDAFAVQTRLGPHITLQAGAHHLGRYWTTTARSSLKAAAIRRRGWASATLSDGSRRRIVAGRCAVVDAAHPCSLAADPVGASLSGGALLRLTTGYLDQLVGYLEAGSNVPSAFAPWGRVLLMTRVDGELLLDGDTVVEARGRWARPGPAPAIRLAADIRSGAGGRRRRAAVAGLPDAVAGLAGTDGPCWLGLTLPDGAVAVPARWDAAPRRVQVGRDVLAALGPQLPGPICVTLDDSTMRRPDRKLGLILRGTGRPVDADPATLALAVEVARATWWEGFSTGSTDVPRG